MADLDKQNMSGGFESPFLNQEFFLGTRQENSVGLSLESPFQKTDREDFQFPSQHDLESEYLEGFESMVQSLGEVFENLEVEFGAVLWRDFPNGVNVAIYSKDNAEFKRRAESWATRERAVGLKGKDGTLELGIAMPDSGGVVKTITALGKSLQDLTDKAKSTSKGNTKPHLIRNLAFFSHGWGTTLSIGSGLTASNVSDVIKRLAPFLADDVTIMAYGCSICSDPSAVSGGWLKSTMEGGGTKSLCAKIRDTLVDEGKTSASVWGHTEIGHTTRNWSLRVFYADATKTSGGKGAAGVPFAGQIVFGEEKTKVLADIEKMLPAMNYTLDEAKRTAFQKMTLKVLVSHMYTAYGRANIKKTKVKGKIIKEDNLTFKGANLAEVAPLYPSEVAKLIQDFWRTHYWTDTKREQVVKELVKQLARQKVITKVTATKELFADYLDREKESSEAWLDDYSVEESSTEYPPAELLSYEVEGYNDEKGSRVETYEDAYLEEEVEGEGQHSIAEIEDLYEELSDEEFYDTEFADFEGELLDETHDAELESFEEGETFQGLSKKLNFLSLLPHVAEINGADVPLTPSVMDPGIYDGPQKYKIALTLQQSLQDAMKKSRLGHVRVALVDLTKGLTAPEFAGYYHKDQQFAASTLKIVPMLAAFQLRHDLRHALKQKGSKTLDDLFSQVRDDWAATQLDPKGTSSPFTAGITLRGKLVLLRGVKVGLIEPKVPHLENIFAKAGSPVAIDFNSTGESFAQLQTIVKDFNKGKRGSREALSALGFLERMKLMVGGDVPASNFATFTVVGDLGYLYMISTLLQSGLYDTNRNGGLWLGARYGGVQWRGALAGGAHQSTTAGSMAAFLTLMMQDKLVSPAASGEMRDLLQKVPNLTAPGTGSWYQQSLRQLSGGGSIKRLLAKVGLAGGADECAFIEREVNTNGTTTLLRYVVVALRANNGGEIEKLVKELDKCILANNGLTPVQGGIPLKNLSSEYPISEALAEED